MLSGVKVTRVLILKGRPGLVGLLVVIVRPVFLVCRDAFFIAQAMVEVPGKLVCVAGGVVSVRGLLEVSAGLFLYILRLGFIAQGRLLVGPLPRVPNSWLLQNSVLPHHFLRVGVLSIHLHKNPQVSTQACFSF